MQEAELREQQEAFRNNMAIMNTWDPLPPYRPRSPSPDNSTKIQRDMNAVARDDPEWLQKMQAIAQRIPTRVMSAEDRERACKKRKLLSRQVEDGKLARKEADARYLDSLHESPTVFGQPRNPQDPVPNYYADVAKEKAALQQKRLEEDREEAREEEERAKKEYAIRWLDDYNSRTLIFGVPIVKKTVAPGGIPDPRIQENRNEGQGKRKRTDEITAETTSWDSAQNKEDQGSSSSEYSHTGSLIDDSFVKASAPAPVDAEATVEDQVDAPVLPDPSPTPPPSSNSSAGGTRPSEPDSEPEVMLSGHTENDAGARSPPTTPSTASSQLGDHDQAAGKQLTEGPNTENKDGH